MTSDRVMVKFTADDRIETVLVSALSPWEALTNDQLQTGKPPPPIEGYSDVVWARALEEHRVISELVEGSGNNQAGRQAAALSLGISARHIKRKIERFLELRTVEAFLPQCTGPQRGKTYLHPTIERLVMEEIHQALKLSPDIGVDDIYELILAAAKALDLKPPGRGTVNTRLQRARRQLKNLPADIGSELAYRTSPVRHAIGADVPLGETQMDHTVCDVHACEPLFGYPIGRPLLSMLIDRRTRVILGMLLSLEAPSRLSVGLCMHHSIFHKQSWLQDLGLPDACWPGFGLPAVVYTDNAKEFKAQSLRRSMQLYGIEQKFRPVGDPAAGGIIERAIGTFMTKFRLLPGTSYSKLLGAAPRHADRKASFTIPDLTEYLVRQVSIYHKTRQDGLGMPPLSAWEREWVINGKPSLPRIPDSADKFRLTFLPGNWRTVTRSGIEMFSMQYQSPALEPLVEQHVKRMVRYDPRDLSEVFVEGPTGHVRATLTNTTIPPFSLWEWREIRSHQIEEGRSRDPEKIAAELRANRELIKAKSHGDRGWRAARRMAREQAWQSVRPERNEQPRTTKTAPLAAVPLCRVKE
jgi:putative transposase